VDNRYPPASALPQSAIEVPSAEQRGIEFVGILEREEDDLTEGDD
jgi:hypothetical protein